MRKLFPVIAVLSIAPSTFATGFVDFAPKSTAQPIALPSPSASPVVATRVENLAQATAPSVPAAGPSTNWLVGASGWTNGKKSEGGAVIETRIGTMQHLFGTKFSPVAFGLAGTGPNGAVVIGGGIGGNFPISSNGWWVSGVVGAGHASDLGTVAIGSIGIYFTFSS